MSEPPVVLLGAGGHGGVVLDTLLLTGRDVAGVCDPALEGNTTGPRGLPILDEHRLPETHPPDHFALANGVGMLPGQATRRALFERMTALGYAFTIVCHPRAIVADTAVLRPGAQIMAGAIVQNASEIGTGTILNTGAQVDHDCHIGNFAHVAPGAVLSGDVEIGEGAFVGAGAVVGHGVRIGRGAVVGAGAIILRDVPDRTRVVTPSTRNLAPHTGRGWE